MRKLLIAATAAAAVVAATQASAQVYFDADDAGVGVQVGPLGVGVGPQYDPYYRHEPYYRDHYTTGYEAYSPGCRVVQERVTTPAGRVIIQTRRDC